MVGDLLIVCGRPCVALTDPMTSDEMASVGLEDDSIMTLLLGFERASLVCAPDGTIDYAGIDDDTEEAAVR